MRDKKASSEAPSAHFIYMVVILLRCPLAGDRTCAGVAVPPPGELVSSGPVPQPDMNSFSYALNPSAPWEGRQRRQSDGKGILSCDVFMALRNTGANMQKVEGYNWKGIVVRNARGRGREGDA